MKNKAARLLKQITSALTGMAKALKSKTGAVMARLIIFSLLRNRKILTTSITHKPQALMGREQESSSSKATLLFQQQESVPDPTHATAALEEDEFGDEAEDGGIINNGEKYPDLTHSLFEDDMEIDAGAAGSVIELVKKSKPEGEEFRLEDEIDQVADLFIQRFHRQMMIQKQQLSFNGHQEMLDTSA